MAKDKGKGKADDKAITKEPLAETPKPKPRNRRKKVFEVQKFLRAAPAMSPDEVNTEIRKISESSIEVNGSNEKRPLTLVESVQHLAKVSSSREVDSWTKVAEVEDTTAGDKWIADNAEADTQYRVAHVTEPVEYATQTETVRVKKL